MIDAIDDKKYLKYQNDLYYKWLTDFDLINLQNSGMELQDIGKLLYGKSLNENFVDFDLEYLERDLYHGFLHELANLTCENQFAMALLIHIYIQNQVKKKSTLDFIIFDQPSEAYFPTRDETKSVNIENANENDVTLLKRQFKAIQSIRNQHCKNLQIIILEHAGVEYWKNSEGRLIGNDINIIDWKSTGEKLIPESWIDNEQTN